MAPGEEKEREEEKKEGEEGEDTSSLAGGKYTGGSGRKNAGKGKKLRFWVRNKDSLTLITPEKDNFTPFLWGKGEKEGMGGFS